MIILEIRAPSLLIHNLWLNNGGRRKLWKVMIPLGPGWRRRFSPQVYPAPKAVLHALNIYSWFHVPHCTEHVAEARLNGKRVFTGKLMSFNSN